MPTFLLGSYVSLLLIEKNNAPRSTAMIMGVAAMCFALGIVIEIIQPAFGRQTSLIDIVYDLFGVIAGTLLYLLGKRVPSARSWRLVSIIAVITLTLLSYVKPALSYQLLVLRDQRLPILFDFESPFESALWQANAGSYFTVVDAPPEWQGNSTKAGKLSLFYGTYPGIAFSGVAPDWRGYESLSLSIYSPGKQAETLTVRIHDTQHNGKYTDRFNRVLSVEPGLNHFSFNLDEIESSPAARAMQMHTIAGLSIFGQDPAQPHSVYLDNIQLKKKTP